MIRPDGGPEAWRRAARSEHPPLRAAAYQLLAEDAVAEDLELFEHGQRARVRALLASLPAP